MLWASYLGPVDRSIDCFLLRGLSEKISSHHCQYKILAVCADLVLIEGRDSTILSSARAFRRVDVVVGGLVLRTQDQRQNSVADLSQSLSLHPRHISCRLPPLRDGWGLKLRADLSGHVVWKGCRQLRHEVEMMSIRRFH